MDWPTQVVGSWADFVKVANGVSNARPQEKNFITRGQADKSWTLTPSLLRCLPENVTPEDALDLESRALKEFKSQGHLHLRAESLPHEYPDAPFADWWALMQYYGAPTRLLDWTFSPYVAAYFAVEQLPDTDGAVFVVHFHTAMEPFRRQYPKGAVVNENLTNPGVQPELMFWEPPKRTERFVAQQGAFSLSVNVLGFHDGLIAEPCKEATTKNTKALFFQKFVIPAELKPEFLHRLRVMNIAAHSLFPGVDGLGRSVAEFVRLAAQPRPAES